MVPSFLFQRITVKIHDRICVIGPKLQVCASCNWRIAKTNKPNGSSRWMEFLNVHNFQKSSRICCQKCVSFSVTGYVILDLFIYTLFLKMIDTILTETGYGTRRCSRRPRLSGVFMMIWWFFILLNYLIKFYNGFFKLIIKVKYSLR